MTTLTLLDRLHALWHNGGHPLIPSEVAKKPHGDEKAPAIAGQGKLAERIEVEFGPFRSASSSRRAECLLVALPTSWDLLLCAKD